MQNSASPTGKRSKAELLKVLDALNPSTRAIVLAAAKKKHIQARFEQQAQATASPATIDSDRGDS